MARLDKRDKRVEIWKFNYAVSYLDSKDRGCLLFSSRNHFIRRLMFPTNDHNLKALWASRTSLQPQVNDDLRLAVSSTNTAEAAASVRQTQDKMLSAIQQSLRLIIEPNERGTRSCVPQAVADLTQVNHHKTTTTSSRSIHSIHSNRKNKNYGSDTDTDGTRTHNLRQFLLPESAIREISAGCPEVVWVAMVQTYTPYH